MSSILPNNLNPLLSAFKTPYEVPPFEQIKEIHYLPAFKEAIKLHEDEINEIVNNPEEPDFDNTVEALDRSGELLERTDRVLNNMLNTSTTDALQNLALELSPVLSKHEDDIMMNEKLFERIKKIYHQRDHLSLTFEQKTLIEKYYQDFTFGGANLDKSKKEQLRSINKKLSVLSLRFADNVLKEDNNFILIIENENDLEGLPGGVVKSAAETASNRAMNGKWVFTLHKPSIMPFLQYSQNRELRKKMYFQYINRGNNNNEFDNKKIIAEIISLRIKKAELLGYNTYADFVLERNMAKAPGIVYKLLDQLWKPSLLSAERESAELQQMIDKEGGGFKLEPWDWRYYAERLRKEKYDLNDEILRPYFMLDNARQGAFITANKLYGLSFVKMEDVPVYSDEVDVFEVKDKSGNHIGILYMDYFARSNKRGGAWMDEFIVQSKYNGRKITPVVINVFNFSKPVGDQPSLLTFDEVTTLFHEFGHALHGLLSDCTYKRISGTSVSRDFVEFPSQIMENWASEPEVLKLYARHYKTNEIIPNNLIEKIRSSALFNQGFATTEYLAAAILDMDWHTETNTFNLEVEKFEERSLQKMGLISEIDTRYRSTYFSHIFDNDYSACYYSYIWAQVLVEDAFETFKEKGIFNPDTASSFRENILSKGASEESVILYKRFKGDDPNIYPLLKRKGFVR